VTDNDRFETWLEKVCLRELPQNPLARVRTLAKELAEGAIHELWNADIRTFRGQIADQTVAAYMRRRWGDSPPSLQLLIGNGYLEIEKSAVPTQTPSLIVARPAYDLLEETEPTSIFISYKRSESSAFALLVLARLKAAGLEPFLDLALLPGDNWQKSLQERIQRYDHLIALLGQETLSSEVCVQEIGWALDYGLTVIPVWHNGFKFVPDAWPNLPRKIGQMLQSTHAIRVIEESALGYHNAIVELLNRFGVTP
jgi:hypothetical protein